MRSIRKPLSARDYTRAGILTAAIPVLFACATLWFAPWACDAGAWLCLLSLTLIYVSPVAALLLPMAVFLNRRAAYSLPEGFLAVTLLTGFLAQVIVSSFSIWSSEPHMRRIFFVDILIFPQGFAAGVMVGALFWLSLYTLSRRPDRN